MTRDERLADLQALERRKPTPLGFVWCPAGSFVLGADPSDGEAYADERPAHHVTLTEGFFLKATPVTQAEWQAVAGFNPSHFKNAGSNAPVERVSWFEAVWFCNRLSQKEGLPEAYGLTALTGTPGQEDFSIGSVEILLGGWGYRLPTEAEWEYACRAGTTTPRYGHLDDVAWWGAWEETGNAQVTYDGGDEERGTSCGTHPVGQKQPNGWGLYEMLGNVLEWCHDWYSDYSSEAAADPVGASTGKTRVVRGGSWRNSARSVRASLRSDVAPTERSYSIGFRVIRPNP